MKRFLLLTSALILLVFLLVAGRMAMDRPDESKPANPTERAERIEAPAQSAANVSATPGRAATSDPFRDWTQTYLAAPRDERANLVQRGVALAVARREAMARLIQTDPEQALAAMVSPATRAALPTEVVAQLEEIVTGEGFFGVLSICHLHGASESEDPSVDHRSHVKREVGIDGRFFTAHTYGSRLAQLTTENASIFGVALDGHLALHEDAAVPVTRGFLPPGTTETAGPGELAVIHNGDIAVFESEQQRAAWIAEQTAAPDADADGITARGLVFDPGTPPTGASPPTAAYNQYTGRNSHQLGPKTVMLMVVRPSDGEAYGASVPTHTSTIAGVNSSSQWYYNESYKQTWFGPKEDSFGVVDTLVVTVELPIPKTVQEYKNSFGSLRADAKAAVEAQGGDWTNNGPKDPDRFDRWVVVAKSKLIDSTGLAYVGGNFSWSGTNLGSGTARHEWGHNWGVSHANFWVGDNSIPRNSSGSHTEYGDGACIMGGSGSFNPLFKERFGFLYTPDGDITEVTTSGTYRVFDLTEGEADKPATRARALKIPITGTSSVSKYLMFSLRHDGGTNGGSGRSDWNRNALELHSDQVSANGGNNDGSHFLDTTPGSKLGTSDRDDGALLVGRTYSEPADLNGTSLLGAVHVTPISRGSLVDGGVTHEYMDVVVNVGNFAGNQPPTVGLAASKTTAAPGEAITFTTTASDPNGDPLAYSFTFGDGSYGFNNAAVLTHAFSSAGFQEAVVTVSDGKGGTASASQFINVGNQPVYDPVIPGATIGGLRYDYYEQSFSNLPNFEQLLPVASGTVSTVSIAPRLRNDDFAFSYRGFISVPSDDVYTFYLRNEDGAALTVAGQLLINSDGVRSSADEASASIALKAGLHPIAIGFFHLAGSEELALDWRANAIGNVRTAVPASALKQRDYSGNSAPVVTVTAPTPAAEFPLGSPISISASASDADGVTKVSFFAGSLYLGQSTTAPHTFNWTTAPIGGHALTAVAYDAVGQRTQSIAVNVSVVPSAVRRGLGLNFFGKAATADATIPPTALVGAVYPAANWNNLDSNERRGLNGTVLDLVNSDGAATAADVTWYTAASDQFARGTSTADISTPAGRLMRGVLDGRADQAGPSITVTDIPYSEYDVFVYFEGLENANSSTRPHQITLTPTLGPTPSPRFGMNARTVTSGSTAVDYSNYGEFTGFRESTATTLGNYTSDEAQIQRLLGNYVVFRGIYAPGITVRGLHTDSGALNYVGIAGIQIVEAPPTIARLFVAETDAATRVVEGGPTDSLEVNLTVQPTNGATVTVTLDGGGQLAFSPDFVTFDASNYDVPRSVSVSAVDDDSKEGDHLQDVGFALVSSTASNFSGVTPPPISVRITDNDKPTLALASSGTAAEAGATAATVTVTRSGITGLDSPETFALAFTGEATAGADYNVTGADSFDTASGAAVVTIPAGATSARLTVRAVDDTLGEGAETIIVTINPDALEYDLGTPSTITFEILDDEILLSEDFENFPAVGDGNGWSNGTGTDFDWTVNAGDTPSSGTGPTVDHSEGSATGTYLYTEASDPNFSSKRADLISPTFDLAGLSAASLEFYYHLFGSDTGTLHVDVFADGTWHNSVDTIVGQQQASQTAAWRKHSVPLDAYLGGPAKVRFRGVTGPNFAGDMAIDSVSVLGSTSPSRIDQWRLDQFGTTENSGVAADSFDANSNGRVNLLEFAQATDPLGSRGLITPFAARVDGANSTFEFRWRKGNFGVTRKVWMSTALAPGSWSEITTTPTPILSAGDTDADVLQVTVPTPAPGDRLFFRLEVSRD